MATTNLTRAQEIAEGIRLIVEWQPNAFCAAEHDVFYCGHSTDTPPDLRAKLEALGWHVEEEYDSWARFT